MNLEALGRFLSYAAVACLALVAMPALAEWPLPAAEGRVILTISGGITHTNAPAGAYMRVRDKGPLSVVYPLDNHAEMVAPVYRPRMIRQRRRMVVK